MRVQMYLASTAVKQGGRCHCCLQVTIHVFTQEVKLPPGIEPLVLWEPAEGTTEEPVIVDVMLARWLRPHQREGVQFLFDCVTGLRSDIGQGQIMTSALLPACSIVVTASLMWLAMMLHGKASCIFQLSFVPILYRYCGILEGHVLHSEAYFMQALSLLMTWALARHCKASLCCGLFSTQATVCLVASLLLSVLSSAAQPVSSATGTARSRSGSRYTLYMSVHPARK